MELDCFHTPSGSQVLGHAVSWHYPRCSVPHLNKEYIPRFGVGPEIVSAKNAYNS